VAQGRVSIESASTADLVKNEIQVGPFYAPEKFPLNMTSEAAFHDRILLSWEQGSESPNMTSVTGDKTGSDPK